MRLIDADEAIRTIIDLGGFGKGDAEWLVSEMETADDVPVIRCKDCKYFEYDSVAKVDGIPLIVAHEICTKWGEGCKTNEDGYCFLAEGSDAE